MRCIDYDKFKYLFLKTDIGKRLTEDFDAITCTNKNNPPHIDLKYYRYNCTEREMMGNNFIRPVKSYSAISIVSFFYLEILQEDNPTTIYDIGCGWNVWKKYYPNIIGVDSASSYADIHDSYNEKFVSKWKGKMDSAFLINMSANIIEPVTYDSVGNIISTFSEIIKHGGTGYVSLPWHAFYRNVPRKWYDENHISYYNPDQVEEYVRQKIMDTNLEIIALDLELDFMQNLPSIDGEVRVVFRKI